jgi:hypothetical protein
MRSRPNHACSQQRRVAAIEMLVSPAAWEQFAKRLHVVSGDFSAPASEAYATFGLE